MRLLVICISVILFSQNSLLNAEEQLPQCFPSESAWDIFKLSKPPSFNNEADAIDSIQKLSITFRKNAMVLPSFYGFAYLKEEMLQIPKITNQTLLKKHFLNINLTELDEDEFSIKENGRSYDFPPDSKGTWVVYLVASLNQIPFLEKKGLRIHPDIERQRGGTVFSGSSLHLTETVDYKACLITPK